MTRTIDDLKKLLTPGAKLIATDVIFATDDSYGTFDSALEEFLADEGDTLVVEDAIHESNAVLVKLKRVNRAARSHEIDEGWTLVFAHEFDYSFELPPPPVNDPAMYARTLFDLLPEGGEA